MCQKENIKHLCSWQCYKSEGLLKTLFQFVWGDKSENDGLKSIADKIRDKDNFGKYIYLAYELPELRNHIAHGDMIEIDTKLACEILMVLNRLIKEIDSEEQDYKKIIAFLMMSVQPI